MYMEGTKVQPKIERPKTEQELAQEFIKEYQALCEKHGFQIVVNPAFKAMADTGTFNVVLQTSVGRLARKE
jgi:hypothetical protein